MGNGIKEPLIKQYFTLSINLRKELLKKGQDEVAELIRFIISLMGTLGIIAGFGFTAYQYVLNPFLFFGGEILIVGAIIYLAFRIKRTLVHYAVDTESYVNHWVQKGTEIRTALIEKNSTKIKELEEELENNMSDTSTPPQYIGATVVSTYLQNALMVAAIGAGALIASFIFCL